MQQTPQTQFTGPRRVSYLFGAGASYHALPINTESQDFLLRFAMYSQQLRTENGRPFQMNLWSELFDFTRAFAHYHSYDEVARQLWLNGSEESGAGRAQGRIFPLNLSKLKALMAIYYFFEQVRDKKADDYSNFIQGFEHLVRSKEPVRPLQIIDPRIEPFLEGVLALKPHPWRQGPVRIMSWNYDVQFEIAYSKIKGERDLLKCFDHDHLNVHPGRSLDPQRYREEPFYVHINGVAGLIRNVYSGQQRLMEYNEVGKLSLSQLLDRNAPMDEAIMEPMAEWSVNETFSFAWEDHWTTRATQKYIKQFGFNTRDLVIFGYSLPEGNSRMDLVFLKEFANNWYPDKRIFLISHGPDVKRMAALLDQAFKSTTSKAPWSENASIEIYAISDIGKIPLPSDLDTLADKTKGHRWTASKLTWMVEEL